MYYETWARHERSGPKSPHRQDFCDASVRSLLAGHAARRSVMGRMLATFVPRFYGKGNEEIFASQLSEDEARFVVARQSRCSSWAELCERAAAKPRSMEEWHATPFGRACQAIGARDIPALAEIIDAHPELLEPADPPERPDSLVRNALLFERREESAEARRMTEFLLSRGADVADALSSILIHQMHLNVGTDEIAYWLDRGADPEWMPPNGISVLEHALLRYWNGAAVDLIAKRVVPPRAFWIAAGLGDVEGTLSYLDRNGRPTDAARRSRPDFTAAGPAALPCAPDASDDEILWEAFLIAGLNDRMAVLDAFLTRGFDIDAMPWGQTLLHLAVGNAKADLVEHLVLRGADLELKGWHPASSARELAEWRYQGDPNDPAVKRIYELLRPR
jgi:hypothetical protein